MNDQTQWMEINNRHLAARVKWIRLRLLQTILQANASKNEKTELSNKWIKRRRKPKSDSRPVAPQREYDQRVELAVQEMQELESHEPPPALKLIADRLGLSRFDCNVLALCAAMELDGRIADLCARAHGDPRKPYPTFALAFQLFDDAEWNALSPHSPLRYWRLLEINQPGTQPLTSASLGADERIVNYLKGLNYLDDRLTPLLDTIQTESTDKQSRDGPLPPSQQEIVRNVVDRLRHVSPIERMPVIEFLGHDSVSKRMVASRIVDTLGLSLYGININTLPSGTGDFETLTRLWQRESLLMPLALYIDVDATGDHEKTQLKRFLERSSGVVIVDLEDADTETTRNRISIEINKPLPVEQEQIWSAVLQGRACDQPERLAEQFSFNHDQIRRLAASALGEFPDSDTALIDGLWNSCRVSSRASMEKLARRIIVKATRDRLVLPPEQKALLHQITDQVAYRNRVYEDWGFREQMNRGLGINALFAGESGTGKSMAAEVIANILDLDLYRIDLSAVVSKYIGETEKNLRKLFDAAEDSGAILFFDEADALFGKRSEVKDSHDRYANIEINYLLQRMESYRGLAILATNMKSALDKAFMRRLRFIVDFPFPGVDERKKIWQIIFPPETPVDQELDFDRLAKLNLTGGSIHNIALNAAFLSAQEGDWVTMPMIMNAARTEFRKLEQPSKDSDFRWQEPKDVVA